MYAKEKNVKTRVSKIYKGVAIDTDVSCRIPRLQNCDSQSVVCDWA